MTHGVNYLFIWYVIMYKVTRQTNEVESTQKKKNLKKNFKLSFLSLPLPIILASLESLVETFSPIQITNFFDGEEKKKNPANNSKLIQDASGPICNHLYEYVTNTFSRLHISEISLAFYFGHER